MSPSLRSRQLRREPPRGAQSVPPDVVRAVCNALEDTYRSPRLGNPYDPLDDLVYIFLSNRTTPAVAVRVFDALRSAYPAWESVIDAPERSVAEVLRPAGLAIKRSAALRALLERLRADFSTCTLAPLATWSDAKAERYLCTLPGVSRKVAKCVLLYGFDRAVLPVDVHVHRITTRLGWHQHRRADQSHDTLESLVPPHARYSFHVNCVAHGRALCRPRVPRCDACPILVHCPTGKRAIADTPADGGSSVTDTRERRSARGE